jgi:hypothetical protein
VRAAIEVLIETAGITLALSAGAIVVRAGAETVPEAETETVSETETETVTVTGADAGTSFLAFAPDFRGFRGWERIPVEGAMLPIGAAPGPTAIYVSARPPAGARRWPVGTILVKSIENGPPSAWVIHAMVKRGVPFNRDGALGWEFFELAFDPGSEEPRIVWRGTGPPSGHGYAAMGRDAGDRGRAARLQRLPRRGLGERRRAHPGPLARDPC